MGRFGLRCGTLACESQPLLGLGQHGWHHVQTFHEAPRSHLLPDRFLVLRRAYPHQLAPDLGTAVPPIGALGPLRVATRRQRGQVPIEDEDGLMEVMATCLPLLGKDIRHRFP